MKRNRSILGKTTAFVVAAFLTVSLPLAGIHAFASEMYPETEDMETESAVNETEESESSLETEGCENEPEIESIRMQSETEDENLTEESVDRDEELVKSETAAENGIESGICGDNATYEFDQTSGVLTIRGSGEMYDYEWSKHSPFYNRYDINEIVIENGITRIGSFSFFGCRYLSKVTISDGVTSIGVDAFAFTGRAHRFSINLPESITSIEEYAFESCAIENVVLPDSIDRIRAGTFSYSGLTSVIIPEGVQIVEGEAFEGCYYLQYVYIPESVTEIGTQAFDTYNESVDAFYGGTASQWSLITIYPHNFFKDPIHYHAGLVLDFSSLMVPTTQSAQLLYKVFPSDLAGKVSFISSNPKIASVDSNGKVKAHAYGKATITASVRIDGTVYQNKCAVQTCYYDVADIKEYYYTPVYWAADHGITNGYGNVYFGTDENCTREQMITFLWRQAGKPAAKRSDSPFLDVEKGVYYYTAALWAYENGITKGYSSGDYEGMFGVGLPVTREDVVTFIYRAAGKPVISESDAEKYSFPDIDTDAYYSKAVSWAAKKGITKGYSEGEYAGLFGVGLNVLRQDIVTFLYRYSKL